MTPHNELLNLWSFERTHRHSDITQRADHAVKRWRMKSFYLNSMPRDELIENHQIDVAYVQFSDSTQWANHTERNERI